MLRESISSRTGLVAGLILLLLMPGLVTSYHTGIGGEQSNAGETIDDVAKEGCLCHNGASDNSVQVILDSVPFGWIGGETYSMHLQIIGGPEATGVYTAGFAMRVSSGVLGGEEVQNWEEDPTALTHTEASSAFTERLWVITWQAPATGEGTVNFWITGNSVNGDQLPGVEDKWNQLLFALQEGDETTDALGVRTLFAGDGNVSPPEPAHHGVDLHHMGAKLRAHWLGLLGFGAVLAVIAFAGLLLRYSFSTSYKGRSNQLRLRYKLMRRGDQ
ncbi:MAG TPA: hypothetical protein HA356_07200 [Candidatus Poseidoniaceae archaeon]|nr:MAG TPA: hypothetical protein D7H95_07175 [Candidatus Poseidoniales archaeon]HII11842.1 hypothetical protein [Candidatus Poseidoniaceae archaeon]|tara:strand:- start:7736 stop:8554 length:819 start_codon:yes stop_codon:yes gene_type:complete